MQIDEIRLGSSIDDRENNYFMEKKRRYWIF